MRLALRISSVRIIARGRFLESKQRLGIPHLLFIAHSEGKFTQKELDDKVRRVLRLFYRTTMNPNRPHGFLCSESHYAAARQIAEEGIVLLQNRNNVLPINTQKAKRVLVVGENAIKMMTVGSDAHQFFNSMLNEPGFTYSNGAKA